MKTELAVFALFLVGWVASAAGTCAYDNAPPLGGVMFVNCSGLAANESCYLYVSNSDGVGVGRAPSSIYESFRVNAQGNLVFGLPVPQSPYHVGTNYSAAWFCSNSSLDALTFVPGTPGQPVQVSDWMAWLKNEGNLAYLGLIGCAGVVMLVLIGLGLSILSKAKGG